MKNVKIEVSPRDKMTKNELSRFRSKGNVPAILYGKYIEKNIPIFFNSRVFSRILHSHGKSSILLFKSNDSNLDGLSALIKDIQRDPIRDTFLNVDLIEIRKGEKITVSVSLDYVGEPIGVSESDGVTDVQKRDVEIECLPKDIPEKITVDISNLQLNDVFHVSDLSIPEGVKILADGELPLVSVRVVREKVEKVVEEEVEEGVEAEAVEGEEAKEEGAKEEAPAETKESKPTDTSKPGQGAKS